MCYNTGMLLLTCFCLHIVSNFKQISFLSFYIWKLLTVRLWFRTCKRPWELAPEKILNYNAAILLTITANGFTFSKSWMEECCLLLHVTVITPITLSALIRLSQRLDPGCGFTNTSLKWMLSLYTVAVYLNKQTSLGKSEMGTGRGASDWAGELPGRQDDSGGSWLIWGLERSTSPKQLRQWKDGKQALEITHR